MHIRPRYVVMVIMVFSEMIATREEGVKIKIKINKNIHLLNKRWFKCFEMEYEIKYEIFKKYYFFSLKKNPFSSKIFVWGVKFFSKMIIFLNIILFFLKYYF